MATVAAVYTVAPYVRTPEQVVRSLAPWHEPAAPRPPVEHKRVWASLEKDPEAVLEEAFREALRRDPQRQKNWVGLVDGNQTQLDLLAKLARQHQVKLTVVLDLMHVAEYLWSASLAFHDEASPQREQWVGERLHNVLLDKAARWSLEGAEAALRLRALRSSGDFDAYWDYHVAQEYQRNHVARYVDGNVVPIKGRTTPTLRRVK